MVEKAKQYLQGFYQQYTERMNPLLDEELDKLAELEDRHKVYQLSLFENERKRSEQERLVDELFDKFTTWVTETLSIQNNPYIRIAAVLKGVAKSMDLTGITNQNEYYTNHYFSSIFEENASDTISRWRAEAKESDTVRTPWALLREAARQYYPVHDRFLRSKFDTQTLANIRTLADIYLSALGYPAASPEGVELDEVTRVPVYVELNKPNGAPCLCGH